jgi:hypothetical protein
LEGWYNIECNITHIILYRSPQQYIYNMAHTHLGQVFWHTSIKIHGGEYTPPPSTFTNTTVDIIIIHDDTIKLSLVGRPRL